MKTYIHSSVVMCIFISVLFFQPRIFAQKSGQKYEEGKIFFRLKNENALKNRPSDGIVGIDEFPMLKKTKDYFNISSIENPFYTAQITNPSGEKLLNTYLVKFEDVEKIDELISFLEYFEIFEYVEKVPFIELLDVPNDSLYVSSILGANPMWLYTLINAETAWDYSHGDPNIKVAIIDNAIWTDHPDLQGKFVEIKDFADNDNITTPYSSANDAYGRQWSHGTHVTGLVGAITNNNMGIASIGYNISLMAYKMYNDGTLPMPSLTAGITAIQWAADHGANVINISWGTTNQMQTLQDAVTYAYNAGCVVVAAAGNNGDEEQYYPAACDHVIAVTSVGMDDKISYFSNYGNFVDLSSPGGYGPTDAGTWSPVSTTYHQAYAWASILGNIRYDGKVGTSMAAPVVSGLCGLMLSLDSNLTPDETEQILKLTSVDVDGLNPSYAGKMGTGRINAGAAMAYVYNLVTGLNENENDISFSVYPTPSTGIVTLDYLCNNEEPANISIYDLLGHEIHSESFEGGATKQTRIIDLSEFGNGIYTIHLNNGQNYYSSKLVLTK